MKELIRVRSALLTLALILVAGPADLFGQDAANRITIEGRAGKTTIEFKDGRVLVNGEEVNEEDGRFVIRGQDGRKTVVLRSSDGHDGRVVIYGDDDAPDFFVSWDDDDARFYLNDGGARGLRSYSLDGDNRLTFENYLRDFGGRSGFAYRTPDDLAVLAPDQTFDVANPDFFGRALWLDSESRNEQLHEQMEIAKLDQEARDLALKVRRAEGADRPQLEQELDQKLSEIFDRKLALRGQEVNRLADNLTDEQAKLDERRQDRSLIIDRRKRQLLGEEDHLRW